MGYRRLAFEDGQVEYVVDGPEDARDLLVFHVGTPSAAVRYAGLIRAAAAARIRVASYSRGGYGASTRRPGRSVADEARITAALVDRLGFERFFVAGWSGGGPAALACAALLGDRVVACLALASITPPVEVGPAWETFWSPQQYTEWKTLATGDAGPLLGDFEEAIGIFGQMTPKRLLSIDGPLDARGLAHDIVEQVQLPLVRSMRRAVSRGYFGYLDDNLAQARDWGFRVSEIRVPVVIRHGELDRLVPMPHGRWLANAIPGARARFHANAGHSSIALPWSEVVADLVSAAHA